MVKRFIVSLSALTLVLSLGFAAFADTIRLKDGSVIRGDVVGFKDQQFTVLVGAGSRGRRSTVTLYMEDVESIEFDSTGAVVSSEPPQSDDSSVGSSTQSSSQLPRPQPSRPSNTQPSSGSQPPTTRPTNTTSSSSQRPTNNQPATIQINTRVRGDNSANGWTNSGLVVRRGQRLRITAMGQVSLGNGRFATPAGLSTLADREKLMQNEPTGGLIAVIGDDNNDFIFVGRTRDFIAQRDGVLFLGVNEGNLADNTGAYDAVIEADAR